MIHRIARRVRAKLCLALDPRGAFLCDGFLLHFIAQAHLELRAVEALLVSLAGNVEFTTLFGRFFCDERR